MSGLGLTFLRRGNLAHPTAGSDYILSEGRGDPEVLRILMSKGVSSDGVGITKEDAERVKTIDTWFSGSSIVSFTELKYFTNVTILVYRAFKGCSQLQRIDLSNVTGFNGEVFMNCANLEDIATDGSHWAVLNNKAFSGCSNLKADLRLDSITGSLGYAIFERSGISSIIASYTNYFGAYQGLINCSNLRYVLLGEACKNVGTAQVFNGCTSLEALIFTGAEPPTLYSAATLSRPTNCPIYVPDDAVATYKAAANWTGQANYIKGISNLQADLPIIYNEVKDYL